VSQSLLSTHGTLRLRECHLCRIILVDSTRSGKRIPDALSKTVPIWCAVINRALRIRYPDINRDEWDDDLYTPRTTVSSQEHSQISMRIYEWALALAVSATNLPMVVTHRPSELVFRSAKTAVPVASILDHPCFHKLPKIQHRLRHSEASPCDMRLGLEASPRWDRTTNRRVFLHPRLGR
jgi:hypothetical protein